MGEGISVIMKKIGITVDDIDIAMKLAMEDPTKTNVLFVYATPEGVGMIASNMKDQKLMQAIKDFGAALEKINGESTS